MKKRILSILLCLALLFGVVPIWSAPVHAATTSQLNIVDRANYLYNATWVCQRTVKGWCDSYTFNVGNTYHIPYGQPVTAGAYVGFGVSVDDYLAAAANANSVFYTARSYYSGYSSNSTYYATDCSGFVSWCWGVSRKTTYTIPGISQNLGYANSSNVYNLQLGDALNSNSVGHVVLVTGLAYNNGTLTQIEITEQTPPQLKRTYYTPAGLAGTYGSNYTIQRYNGDVPASPDGGSGSAKLTDPVVFNASYYRSTNADLANMTDDQLKQHWLDYGIKEGRCASPAFNVKWYLQHNTDVANAFGADNYKEAILHFINSGINEGRPGSADFYNLNYYKANSPDLRVAFGYDNYSYYKHFVDYGYYDGGAHPVDREANLIDGVYKFYSAIDQNYAMNISGSSLDEGANLHLWDADEAHAFVVQSSPDGYYYIRAQYSNKYLDVSGNGTENGTNVSQYAGNGTDAQKWSIEKNDDGTYSFYALASGKALDVNGANASNGANIQIYTGNGSAAQKWIAVAQKTVNDGVYSIASATATGQTLHVHGAATTDAASLVMWEREDVMWEKLAVEYVGDGYYTLRMLSSNLYMDVTGAQSSDGTDVEQYAYNGSDAQLWRIVPNNDGTSYNIVSKLKAMHLDRTDGNDANGTNVQICSPNRGGAQKWLLNPTTVGLDGIWNIAASDDNSYVLDIAESTTEQGGNLQLAAETGSDSQKFIVQSIENEYYVIRALHSGRNLSIDGGAAEDGTNVMQWNRDNAPENNEKWQIIPNADGTYSFVGVCNGLYLDLRDNTLADGTNVQMFSHNAAAQAQRWNLTNRYAVVGDGDYKILSSGNQGYALEIAGTNEDELNADGANVQIYSASDSGNQDMRLTHMGDGYYTITNTASGKVLEVNSETGKLTNGLNVRQNTANGSDAQLWTVLPNNDGSYTFVSKLSGKTMDIHNGIVEDARNVQTYQGNTSAAQKWILELKGHTHTKGEKGNTVAPTCTEQGYTAYTCSFCGETFRADFVEALGHTEVTDEAVAPGCETTGLTEGSHCSACDEILVEQTVLAATGHTINSATGKVVEPTCTEPGYTEYACLNCGKSLIADVTDVIEHTPVVDEMVAPTCLQTGLTEGSHCDVCKKELVPQEVIPATGHSYTYADNGDGTHTVGCENCDYSEVEDHSFTDGTCICGAEEVPAIPTDANLKFISDALSLQSNINFQLTSNIKGLGYERYYVEVVRTDAESGEVSSTLES
ncbi:MAG: RICIN domain-containing protein, partial [Faecousia sp.]